MRKIFSIDRAEGELFVCISDDDDVVNVEKELLGGMAVRDIFSAELHEGELSDVIPMPEERDRRIAENRARLERILARSKKS